MKTIAWTAVLAAACLGAAPAPAVPVLADDWTWARWVLIGVAALIALAALLGPLVRMGMPDELPPTHSHDEPPGSSHHHGASGTVDFTLPERPHL